jgi:uncharacterized OB-fold protein
MMPAMTAEITIIEPAAPRLLPPVDEGNREFWTGGAEGRLLVPYCDTCGRWSLPPRPVCPRCGGAASYRPTSGRATVLTWTVNHHQFHPDVPPPNIIAVVVLSEQDDLRLATNLVDCEPDEVRCGLAVTVRFERHPGAWYPVFAPAVEA